MQGSPSPYTILPYGKDTWLLQLKHTEDFPLLLKIHQAKLPNVILESVIGYDSLLVITPPQASFTVLQDTLLNILQTSTENILPQRHHEIKVRYDGEDLEELATAKNISPETIVQLHTSALYTVLFLGFSPGFGYLDGLPKELHAPRRATPRTCMKTGSVAIGGAHTGIYTTPSPGGWNWIGNTEHSLFKKELNSSAAFTLKAGDTVKFCAI